MTRKQLKKLLPEGMGSAEAEALYEALLEEEKKHRQQAEQADRELERLNEQMRAAQEKARAYDELLAQNEREREAEREREEEEAFRAELEGALRERGVRSMKAALALMDVEALRGSRERRKEIGRAVEALAGSEDGRFLFERKRTGRKVQIGGGRFGAEPHGGAEERIRRAAGLK